MWGPPLVVVAVATQHTEEVLASDKPLRIWVSSSRERRVGGVGGHTHTLAGCGYEEPRAPVDTRYEGRWQWINIARSWLRSYDANFKEVRLVAAAAALSSSLDAVTVMS